MSKMVKTSIEEVVDFLSEVNGFSSLELSEKNELAELMQKQSYEANEVIFQENDMPAALYFVADGTVGVYRGERLIAKYGAGQLFGEMGILDDLPRRATVKSFDESFLYLLPEHKLKDVVLTNSNLSGFFDDLINMRLAVAI